MARPIVTNSAEDLYEGVLPLAHEDESNNWALLHFCEAFIGGLQPVEDIVRDDVVNDAPGWSIIVDVDRAPYVGLPWLGQFVGVTTPDKLMTEDESEHDARSRDYIRNTGGFDRGTLASIIGATQQNLTGSKTVILFERYQGSAYKLRVVTFTEETPSPATTLADILAQKPGGIVLTYDIIAKKTYDSLDLAFATYNLLDAGFATYNLMDAGQGGLNARIDYQNADSLSSWWGTP